MFWIVVILLHILILWIVFKLAFESALKEKDVRMLLKEIVREVLDEKDNHQG